MMLALSCLLDRWLTGDIFFNSKPGVSEMGGTLMCSAGAVLTDATLACVNEAGTVAVACAQLTRKATLAGSRVWCVQCVCSLTHPLVRVAALSNVLCS